MTNTDDPIIVTQRDIYNLLKDHIENVTEWQTAHASSDQKAFTSLNIKFYGILAGIISVLAVIASTGAIHI